MLNDQGGINGRKINFLSYDDAYSPPKTVEQTRQLVEEDGVLLMLNPLGTPTNCAIQHYLNQKKVPQLFVATGATKWDDPEALPVDDRLAAELSERRRAPMPPISSSTSRTARSGCCIRTTILARTI